MRICQRQRAEAGVFHCLCMVKQLHALWFHSQLSLLECGSFGSLPDCVVGFVVSVRSAYSSKHVRLLMERSQESEVGQEGLIRVTTGRGRWQQLLRKCQLRLGACEPCGQRPMHLAGLLA